MILNRLISVYVLRVFLLRLITITVYCVILIGNTYPKAYPSLRYSTNMAALLICRRVHFVYQLKHYFCPYFNGCRVEICERHYSAAASQIMQMHNGAYKRLNQVWGAHDVRFVALYHDTLLLLYLNPLWDVSKIHMNKNWIVLTYFFAVSSTPSTWY